MSIKSEIAKKEIPIFFSTDDNYTPYLDVAIASLIANASKEYSYRIVVLNTGLYQDNVDKIKMRENQRFAIDFVDISNSVEKIKSYFKNVYHFSIVTYYRIFISSLFPQYDKIVYLDCDVVVLGDVSQLYNIDLGNNILAATPDQYIPHTEEFCLYTENAIGVDRLKYVNAGVLVINLDEYRKQQIEEKFIELITTYDFDLVDPDQAYLNYLCRDKIYILPNGWNKQPTPALCEGKKNVVHYALYKKPWQYDDVIDGECFWTYAKNSPFYEHILKNKSDFSDEDKAKKEADARDILEHAVKIVESEYTFVSQIDKK